jgi:tetratricopeptide (TPR) repeat protein
MKTRKTFFFTICIFLIYCLGKAQSPIFANAKKLFYESKFEESRKLFNTIGKNSSEYAEARYYLGKSYYNEKKYDEAIESFREAVTTNNKNAGYYFMLGNAYREKAMISSFIKKLIIGKEIIKNWEITAKLDSTHEGVRWDLMNYYSCVPTMFGGDMGKAYKLAEEIKKINYPNGCEARGYVCERDHKNDLAVKSFNEAIKASPKVLKYYYALAYFYQRQNTNDLALPVFEKIITIDPNEVNAHFEIGKTYSTSEKMHEQGIQHLSRCIQLANSNDKITKSKANYYLGNIYKSKADKANANQCYMNALSLDPTYSDAKKALSQL